MREIEFRVAKPLLDTAPHPVPAKKIIPEWYKNISRWADPSTKSVVKFNQKEPDVNLTIKTCVPVRDTICSGYLILSSNDIMIALKDFKLDIQWSQGPDNPGTTVAHHPRSQFPNSPLTKKAVGNQVMLKFEVPWRIRTEAGVSCYFSSPAYHGLPFEILPGIVDTDKYHEINYPFSIEFDYSVKDEQQIFIPRGTPLVHVYPFVRNNWSSKVVAETEEEFLNHRVSISSVFEGFYRMFKHEKKRYE